jgi:hypothetical protein
LAEDRQTPAPAIYLSTAIPYVESYWQFYAIKGRRTDVLERTKYVDPIALGAEAIPHGALMMTLDIQLALLRGLGSVTPIRELDGSTTFAVVRR